MGDGLPALGRGRRIVALPEKRRLLDAMTVRYFPGRRTKDYLRITIGADEQMQALINAVRVMVPTK